MLAAAVIILLMAASLFIKSSLSYGLVVLAAIFIPAEKLLSIRSQKVFRRAWRADVMHFFVNNTLTHAVLLATVAAIFTVSQWLIPNGVLSVIGRQPAWVQFIEAVLLSEAAHYWAHVATHRSRFLWRFHKVHHSIEDMDWLASGRLHPVDQVFTNAATVLPVAILGFDKSAFAAFLIVTGFQAIIVHANIRIRLGKLNWLVVTPEFHHWHHANEPEAYNTNFSNALPLMDYIFGTALFPTKGKRPAKFGISQKAPEGYLDQLAWSFRKRRSAKKVAVPAPSVIDLTDRASVTMVPVADDRMQSAS